MPLPEIVEAKFAAAAKAPEEIPPPLGIEIAFVGRSNVGKSSLMNAMMHRRNLVRTSSTPGCTRSIGFYEVKTRDGATATLVDLPGYGYAKRSKVERAHWGNLIDSYLLGRPTLNTVAMLVDVRRGLEEEETELLKMLEGPAETSRKALNVVVVATKTDRLKSTERKLVLDKLKTAVGRPLYGVSVRDEASCERLWATLRKRTGLGADVA
jgi:GTP-binding protein